MQSAIHENVFNDEFLSPELCETLVLKGITEHVPYHFKIGKDFCIPITYAYDTENIYAQMDANVFSTDAVRKVAAFRVKDLERVFDGYSLVKKDVNYYQLSLTHLTKQYIVSDERMPDCFGKMILQLLSSKSLSAETFNQRITRVR